MQLGVFNKNPGDFVRLQQDERELLEETVRALLEGPRRVRRLKLADGSAHMLEWSFERML